jgi:hypothetical protein
VFHAEQCPRGVVSAATITQGKRSWRVAAVEGYALPAHVHQETLGLLLAHDDIVRHGYPLPDEPCHLVSDATA